MFLEEEDMKSRRKWQVLLGILVLALAVIIIAGLDPQNSIADDLAVEVIVEETAVEAVPTLGVPFPDCYGGHPLSEETVILLSGQETTVDYVHNGFDWRATLSCPDDPETGELVVTWEIFTSSDEYADEVDCGDSTFTFYGATITDTVCDLENEVSRVHTTLDVNGEQVVFNLEFDVANNELNYLVENVSAGQNERRCVFHKPIQEVIGNTGTIAVNKSQDYYWMTCSFDDGYVIEMSTDVTDDDRYGRGDGSYEHPYDPSLFEGKKVKILRYLGSRSSGGVTTISRVKIQTEDEEVVWVRVGLAITLRSPYVEKGLTHYDYEQEHYYSFDDYWHIVDSGFEGIWINDPDYDDEFVDVYAPATPTSKDIKIETHWSTFITATETMPYDGSWYDSHWSDSSYGKCYTMLENFPFVTEWGLEEYEDMFQLCSGERSEPTSVAHLWSVYGMGSGGVWGSSDESRSVHLMTFLSQPPNSTILGVLTPCSEFPLPLIGGLEIRDVVPAQNSFGTVFSDWSFHRREGLDVILAIEGEDYTNKDGVVTGTYFGYIPESQFSTGEWDVLDNYPAQEGEIQLWQIEACQE